VATEEENNTVQLSCCRNMRNTWRGSSAADKNSSLIKAALSKNAERCFY
jgi:hypothetical protein